VGLYQKHRPESFDGVIGQDKTVTALQTLFDKGKTLPHSFLFSGPAGTGKTTLGRIIAQRLGCSDSDYQELDTADFRGIESMRDIRRKVHYSPLEGEVRVWLLDECHQITNDGQEALLKALEDTPEHAFFILCTTNPEKLKPTIRSRCSHFQLQALSPADIGKVLVTVCKAERAQVIPDALKSIAQNCMGSARTALVALEQIMNLPKEKQVASALLAVEEEQQTNKLCQALLKGMGWGKITDILGSLKDDPERVRIGVVNYMRIILSKTWNPKAVGILQQFNSRSYHYPGTAKADLLQDCAEWHMDSNGD